MLTTLKNAGPSTYSLLLKKTALTDIKFRYASDDSSDKSSTGNTLDALVSGGNHQYLRPPNGGFVAWLQVFSCFLLLLNSG